MRRPSRRPTTIAATPPAAATQVAAAGPPSVNPGPKSPGYASCRRDSRREPHGSTSAPISAGEHGAPPVIAKANGTKPARRRACETRDGVGEMREDPNRQLDARGSTSDPPRTNAAQRCRAANAASGMHEERRDRNSSATRDHLRTECIAMQRLDVQLVRVLGEGAVELGRGRRVGLRLADDREQPQERGASRVRTTTRARRRTRGAPCATSNTRTTNEPDEQMPRKTACSRERGTPPRRPPPDASASGHPGWRRKRKKSVSAAGTSTWRSSVPGCASSAIGAAVARREDCQRDRRREDADTERTPTGTTRPPPRTRRRTRPVQAHSGSCSTTCVGSAPASLGDEREEGVPERERVTRMQTAVAKLVDGADMQVAELGELADTTEVEERIAVDDARDVPEQHAEAETDQRNDEGVARPAGRRPRAARTAARRGRRRRERRARARSSRGRGTRAGAPARAPRARTRRSQMLRAGVAPARRATPATTARAWRRRVAARARRPSEAEGVPPRAAGSASSRMGAVLTLRRIAHTAVPVVRELAQAGARHAPGVAGVQRACALGLRRTQRRESGADGVLAAPWRERRRAHPCRCGACASSGGGCATSR